MNEMAKVKVEKALARMPKDGRLKVGAKSGFFYCGTVEDFMEHMDEYSFFAERRTNGAVKKARAALKNALEAAPTPGDYARNNLSVEEPRVKLSSAGYSAHLDLYFDGIEKLMRNVMRAEEAKLAFQQFRFRDVIRAEKTALEENCYVLVLSGEELGKFWELSDAKGTCLSFDTEEEEDA